MSRPLKILVTNDDGYAAKGIEVLVRIMRRFGDVTVIAPKTHQSGMSMAVTMGGRPIAFKRLPDRDGAEWSYLDASPASCVKYGIDNYFHPSRPDVVVCGINHGSNAATAANYSGTLGAAEEASLNGMTGIGVSIDSGDPDADFGMVERFFPQIFEALLDGAPKRYGIFYNVNFPSPSFGEPLGIRVGHVGRGHWEKEFLDSDQESDLWRHLPINQRPRLEEGESLYVMAGEFKDDSPSDDVLADHHLVAAGYVSITAHNVDNGDAVEIERLRSSGIETDFKISD